MKSLLAKLSLEFFRVSKRDGPSGVNLGLAIAKEIVEMHGGGCEFTFTLPVAIEIPATVAI
jgi:signal transduction histidine kinase